tara:strand:- start:426 stop:968 length:543 start_codon:yes stop_codon:yes gene_type:complete
MRRRSSVVATALLLATARGQASLQPLESAVEQQQQPSNDGSAAAISKLNEVLQQSPEAAAIMRKAASDVAARPYARQAVSTLLGLMQTTHGTDVVMQSLQELMGGAHDGPGLRSLAQSLGVDAQQFSQAAQAMQAIPPYQPEGDAAAGGGAPPQGQQAPGGGFGIESVLNSGPGQGMGFQ